MAERVMNMNDTPLAVIIATKPSPHAEHVGAKAERWLLEQFSCTLMNNDNDLTRYPTPMDTFPDAKFIIPIFGYPESWGKAGETEQAWREVGVYHHGNVYYYNCGGTIDGESWNGLDEPGTRGNGLVISYEQARAELRCVKAFFPGLKRVVAHPWPYGPEECWLTNFEVGAWRLTLMENHMDEYADRVAQVPERWAYLIDTDFEQFVNANGIIKFGDKEKTRMRKWAAGIGPRVRAVGASALLINDVSLLPYLYDREAVRLTDVGEALLEGVKAA